MAIPGDYRLLKTDDVGKILGVDLDTTIYFDTSKVVSISGSSSFDSLVENLLDSSNTGVIFSIQTTDGTLIYKNLLIAGGSEWYFEKYEYASNTVVGNFRSSFTDDKNTFIYVKDITVDEDDINVSMSSRFGVRLLTKNKYCLNNIQVTPDPSILGTGSYGSSFSFVSTSTDEVIVCSPEVDFFGRKIKLIFDDTYEYEYVIPNPSKIFNGNNADKIYFGIITAYGLSMWNLVFDFSSGNIYIENPGDAFGGDGALFIDCKYALEVI